MQTLSQLKRLSSAEEFFDLLQVPYDPAVVNVARLHILKRMGEYLGKTAPSADEATELELCREHLQKAYSDFVKSSPIEERVFKVLKDAVKPAPEPPLVPLSALTDGSRAE